MFFIFLMLVGLVGLVMFTTARKKFQTMRNQALRASMNVAASSASMPRALAKPKGLWP